MREIKLHINKETLSFAVQNYKILYGENYIKKYEIFNKIERYFRVRSNDDCYNEVLLDDEPLNKSDFLFFKITSNFDLEEEFKLGSKSLTKKYLELKLQNIEYLEELNTLKIILESLNDNYVANNLNIKCNDKILRFSFDEIDNKQLIKLIDVKLTTEYENMNVYDLNYHEVILMQLKMIEEMISLSDKPVFLLIDCYLDEYLLNEILSINVNDSIILINISAEHRVKNINDYLLVNNSVIDTFDEVLLYYLINKINIFISDVYDFKKLLISYIEGSSDSKINELRKII